MPDARLKRTRATLPDGYRFGDAGSVHAHRFNAVTSLGDAVVDLQTAPIVWECTPVAPAHTHVFELNTTHGGYWCACGEQWQPERRCYCLDGLPPGVDVAQCPSHLKRTVRRGPVGQTN